jgi:hypothetical protein
MPSNNNFNINNGNPISTGGVQVNPIVPNRILPNGTGLITPNRVLPDSELEPLSNNQQVFYVGCQRDVPVVVNENDSSEQDLNSSLIQPEILFTMDFNPLFTDEASGNNFTRFGNFFQTQLAFRNLKCENIEKLISDIEEFDPELKNSLNERRISFYRSSSDLYLKVLFLYNFLNDIENAKYSLDLRSHLSIVCGHDIAKTFINSGELPNEIVTSIWSKYGIQYALHTINPLHKREDIDNLYTNTKTWISLLIETKTCLVSSSPYRLETDSVIRDATQVKDISETLFNVKNISGPNLKIDSSLADIRDQRVIVEGRGNINDILSLFINNDIYTSHLDRTDLYKVFLINNWATRIWRYSKGLSTSRAIEKINSIYQLDATLGVDATTLLNAIFGYTLGVTYTEDPIPVIRARNNEKSLISLAYEAQDGDYPILSFEPKKYEFNEFNVKYGGLEYLDSLLNLREESFNTHKLEEYLTKVEKVEQGFTDVVKTLDLLNLKSILDLNSYESIFHFIEDQLKWDDSYYSMASNSVVAAIFSLAAKNPKLRGLLFIYVMLQVQGLNYYQDINPTTGEMINAPISNILDMIIDAIGETPSLRKLDSSLGFEVVFNNPESYFIFSKESIVNSFTSNRDKFYLQIKSTLKLLIDGLKTSLFSSVDGVNKTLYGKYQDTIAYMTVFDMIVHMINLNSSIEIETIFYSFEETEIRNGPNETVTRVINYSFRTKKDLTSLSQNSPFRQRVIDNLKNIKSNVERENTKIRYGIISIVSTLRKLKNVFAALLNNAKSEMSINSLKSVGKYFQDIRQLRNFLRSENQVHMMLNHLTELKTIDTSSTNVFGRMGSKFKKEFLNLMQLPIFTNSTCKDLNILSIGMPYNIHNLLKSGNRPDRKVQDDIIKIKVYKLEHGYPFLIFKPKEYLFELSRFAAKGNSTIKDTENSPANLIDAINRFATRDRSQVLSSNSELVQYLMHQNPAQVAFQGNDYSYLTSGQKTEIFKNHVLSNVLETYVQYMTFLDLNEMNFDIDSDAYRELISDIHQKLVIAHVKSFLKKRQLPFQSISNFAKAEEAISSLTGEIKKQLDFELGILSNMNKTKSNISNFEAYARGICGTKYFDRVFQILVNPHDFIIDEAETISPGPGSDSVQRFNELKNLELIIPSEIDQGQFVLRKNPVEIYSYFVNIEIL